MSCALALIALSVGYLVYLHASKEKEGVKLLGQVIGIFVMIMAVMAFMCGSAKYMKKNCMMGGGKAPMCPVSAKAEPNAHA